MVRFDTNKSGSLTDAEMQQVMIQTQLDKKTCAKVWDLSNPTRETTFTKEKFRIAMHLMYKKRKDPSVELPDTLPIELAVSAMDDGVAPQQQQPQMAQQLQQQNPAP